MNTRIVVLLAALALPAAAAAQRENTPHATLRAFRSDRELVHDLRSLEGRCTAAQAAAPAPPSASAVAAHDFVVITGRITNFPGCPLGDVRMRIEALDASAATGGDGTYRLRIPGARIRPGQQVQITASRPGLMPVSRSLALSPGATVTLNFRMGEQDAFQEAEGGIFVGRGGTVSTTDDPHKGRDEAGIVKLHGDFLVILRRGRLFTVEVGGGALRPVSMVTVFGTGPDPEAWYDELLVSGDQVVVIGYSHARGGTEIGLFRIDRQGRLHYRGTYHLRADDYYSSRNFTSRLIGTRLVLYAPLGAPVLAPVPTDAQADHDALGRWMPALRRWHRGARDDEFRRILRPERLYRPGRPLHLGDHPVLHTVTRCELGRGKPECDATAVLGPTGRATYVSPTAVYVWTRDGSRTAQRAPATVYRIPLDGSPPAALGVEGSPVDHPSFLESGDGHLNVLVRRYAAGNGVWSVEPGGGALALLRVPLRGLGDGRGSAPAGAYRALPAASARPHTLASRFVGRHLLYGATLRRYSPGPRVVFVVGWAGGPLTEIPVPHDVERIKAIGADAVVTGTDSADLHLSGIRLGRAPRVAQGYVRRGAAEDDGYNVFYRADAPNRGVIGLPLSSRDARDDKSASMLFVENRDAAFRPLGEVATADAKGDDCVTSCMGWYDESRPIFLGGRILALMGYEIVEGAVVDGHIREVRRVSFAPGAMRAKP